MPNYNPFFTVGDFVAGTVRSTWRFWSDQRLRVDRVIAALTQSRKLALQKLTAKLTGMDVETILEGLTDLAIQIAVIYGCSICGCTLIGAGVGALAGGVGAIPGAALGATTGVELGSIILGFIGIAQLVPIIFECGDELKRSYTAGFRLAWTNPNEPTAFSYGYPPARNENEAIHRSAEELSNGHVILMLGILIGVIVVILKNAKAGRTLIAKSKLGDKVGIWAEKNVGNLERLKRIRKPEYAAVADEYRAQKAMSDAAKKTETAGSPKALEEVKSKEPKFLKNPFATEKDKAFFWSGMGMDGAKAAESLAKQKGGTTLEMVIENRGINLPKFNPDSPATIEAWKEASRLYAEGASGEVRAVLGNNVKPTSIWNTQELPALKANPKVTEIFKVDPKTGVETLIYRRP
ncbi:MAG: hypothetical protein LBG61_02845 [Burkholderiales bacterium]|jgi:hypothetical protein|nr:hypothetical protein [Burkholderiales bacterium]